MATEKDIKKGLLKQLELDTDVSIEPAENSAKIIMQKHKAKLHQLQKTAIVSWIITFLYFMGIYNLKEYLLRNHFEAYLTRDEFWFMRYADMASRVLVVISILITYLVYNKSKTLNLLQICSRLASIENYLKKISPGK
jgi:hypothetical protein